MPDELVDEVALVGSASRIRERGEVTTLILGTRQPEVLPLLADCLG